MGRVLLASACFAVFMELVVVPSFNYVSTDSRWSMLTFAGALMFLVACANLLHCVDWHWIVYVVIVTLLCWHMDIHVNFLVDVEHAYSAPDELN